MSCVEKGDFCELLSFSISYFGFNSGCAQTPLQLAHFAGKQNGLWHCFLWPLEGGSTLRQRLPSSLPDHPYSTCIFIFNEVRSIKVVK